MNRSEMMSKVKARNTAPELLVRKFLHSYGFRYRLHQKALPGKPDIVLRKYRTAIFINGCFWHSHSCKKGTIRPKSNSEFWEDKLRKNVERDEKNKSELSRLGWRIIEVWECQTARQEQLTKTLSELLQDKKGMG